MALSWAESDVGGGGRYVCGAMAEPGRWFPGVPTRWAVTLVKRWIAAATGCDSDLQARPAEKR